MTDTQSIPLTPAEQHAVTLRAAEKGLIAGFAPWQWFATLTFRDERSDDSAHGAFKRWARCIARDLCRSHVTIAWAYEHQARDVMHYHALLSPHARALNVTATQIEGAWPHAYSAPVEAVFDAEGAAEYLLRHAAWNLNVACDRRPRCRRDVCVIAPGPWSAT